MCNSSSECQRSLHREVREDVLQLASHNTMWEARYASAFDERQ